MNGKIEVKIKKLSANAITPKKAHPTDAGYDLYVSSKIDDQYGNVSYGTGVAMEIPDGYVGLVFPRSSNCKTDLLLTNAVGLIDSNYRGEIMAKFANYRQHNGLDSDYKVGERCAQIVIMPYPEVELVVVDELSESDRGANGYGSSGR